ncbi:MAG: 2-oxo acid dehydrogenase subunit E2 [Promethearchaeota archaeon]
MGRYDGTKIKVSPYKQVEAHVMQRRCDSLVYYTAQYDLTKTLPYIEKYNKDRNLDKTNRITLFQLFLLSCSRALAKRPHCNRFLAGRKYWQRNRINIAFVVKKTLDLKSKTTMLKMDFHPKDTIETVRNRFHYLINRTRSDKGNETEGEINFFGKLPRWVLRIATKILTILEFYGKMPKGMIETDPLYASCIVANLGSVGLQGTIIHHLYEWGNASIFLTINKIRRIPVVNEETGQVESRTVVDVGIAIDERIAEGIYFHRILQDMQSFMESPVQLETPHPFTEEHIASLKLKDFNTLPHVDMEKEITIGDLIVKDLIGTSVKQVS